ncbi:MAG: cell wall metabolism sensor histidine kinase WalK [Firmicutes bacterium]|nr:cell wall metabolism sensor histidine kinase WalK [Bacillota bacterium]
MFKGLQWKIVLVYSLLVLFALQLISVYLVQSLENYYLRNFKEGLETQAKLLATFLTPRISEEGGNDFVADIVEGFKGTGDLDIIVLDRYARVTGTSGHPETVGGRIIQAEITKALAGNPDEAIRISAENKNRYYYLAYPIKHDGTVVGVIYLSSSLKKIDQTLREIKRMLISGSILVLIISLAIGMALTRTIIHPIKEVTFKAEQMSRGDFSQRVEAYSDDEIGQLANMYNFLASRLDSTLEEISAEKSKVEAILNYMRDGIVAMDNSERLIHINPAAESLLNTIGSEEAWPGRRPSFLLDTLIGPGMLQSYYDDKQPMVFERTWDHPQRIFRLSIAPFQEEERSAGTLIVLQDITRESEIGRRQQEFVANVSHELKTPLTSMKSYVETLLEERLQDKEVAYKFIQVINKETERMVKLVQDLLTLSKLDARLEDAYRVAVNLRDLFVEIVVEMELQWGRGNIPSMHMKFQENMPAVFVDRNQISQVFVNLLNNAIQYTPPGGRIDIRAEEKEGRVHVCIEDTGIGIPREELDHVFERFYRVDKTRSREYGGTGLGLSISRLVVEAHGGKIWIDSEPGRGTAVWFTLPSANGNGEKDERR